MEARITYLVLIILVAIANGIITFWGLPKKNKVASIKEWLKYAVVEAEKALGSGTGQLKLHMVYDMAVKQFPWIINVISFSTFSEWVDEALLWMSSQLAQNKAVHDYVDSKSPMTGEE